MKKTYQFIIILSVFINSCSSYVSKEITDNMADNRYVKGNGYGSNIIKLKSDSTFYIGNWTCIGFINEYNGFWRLEGRKLNLFYIKDSTNYKSIDALLSDTSHKEIEFKIYSDYIKLIRSDDYDFLFDELNLYQND